MVGLPLMSRVHILSKGCCPWTAERHERTCERIRRSHEKDHVRSVPWGFTEYSVQYNTVRSLLDEKNAPSSEFDRILCQLSMRRSSDVKFLHADPILNHQWTADGHRKLCRIHRVNESTCNVFRERCASYLCITVRCCTVHCSPKERNEHDLSRINDGFFRTSVCDLLLFMDSILSTKCGPVTLRGVQPWWDINFI